MTDWVDAAALGPGAAVAWLALLLGFGLGRVLRRRSDTTRTARRVRQTPLPRPDPLAMAAHELRTPLAGLASVLDTLHRETADPRQRRLIELGRMAGTHLQRLLDDVLDGAGGVRAASKRPAEAFGLRTLCIDVHAFWREAAAGKGLRLDLALDPAVPAVAWGDPVGLRQVLFNLLSNAIKFTDRGRATLRVHPAPQGGPARLRFVVEDTGIGIPAREQPTLFRPFRQAGAAAGGAYGGSGLGLAVCRALVAAMGGQISLDSREGVGTRVTVELTLQAPRAQDPAGPTPRTQATAAPHLGDAGRAGAPHASARPSLRRPDAPRILLAEDNPVAREILCLQLARLGYAADAVPDGASALRALRAHAYGLVLTDMRMEGMDGAALARRIRQAGWRDAAGRPLPVVALSVDSPDAAGIPAVVDGWLVKPVPMDTLAACVARWLGPAAARPPR